MPDVHTALWRAVAILVGQLTGDGLAQGVEMAHPRRSTAA
jgi:hypothetical protein